MKCKTVFAVFSLVLLVVACSDSQQAGTSQPTSSETAKLSTQSSTTSGAYEESVATSTDGSCRSMLEASCLACHSEARICQKLGRKSKKRWERTIARMVKHGANMSSTDQDALSNCLADESADVVQMCK